MSCYITVDGGTTNTRISIVQDLKVIDTLKFNIGARLGMENNAILHETIKNGITEILKKNNLREQDVLRILASGMLTSEFGLLKLPHIETPAGIEELHDSMVETVLEDISTIPMVFIRGVKTPCETLDDADMMRGEESELIGLLEGETEHAVYILPGSHSKIIETDQQGRIQNLTTLLTGEMVAAISQGTILKDAVDLEHSNLEEEYLLLGYEYCLENGFNKSVFKARVLKNMFSKTKSEVYSFFMGVLLCDELKEIIKLRPEKIIVAGRKQIKEATYTVLCKKTDCQVEKVPDEAVDAANARGMVKIFEYAVGK